MTVTEGSLLVIAACNVVAVSGAVFAVMRLRSLAKKGDPLIAGAKRVMDNVEKISGNVHEMSLSVQRLQGRVTGTASQVMDEIEPPIRTLAAVIGGVRAGLNKLFEPVGHDRHSTPERDGSAREREPSSRKRETQGV